MSLAESNVEGTEIVWFLEQGYAIGPGPHFAPCEPAAERESFGELLPAEPLCEFIRQLTR